MNDLRYDPEAHALDERTHYNLKAVKMPTHAIDEHELRTVPMPDLRSPQARSLDAETRDLRTMGQRLDDELAVLRDAIERLADSVTILMLEREMRDLEQQK